MKKISYGALLLVVAWSWLASANSNCTTEKKKSVCTKKSVQAEVEKWCVALGKDGDKALAEIKAHKFDCCGYENYLWIQDLPADPAATKMIMHPVKPNLDGKVLGTFKDNNGVVLFAEFVKIATANAAGGWVKYSWTKDGEKDPTPKESFVKACSYKGEKVVLGSGTWL